MGHLSQHELQRTTTLVETITGVTYDAIFGRYNNAN